MIKYLLYNIFVPNYSFYTEVMSSKFQAFELKF